MTLTDEPRSLRPRRLLLAIFVCVCATTASCGVGHANSAPGGTPSGSSSAALRLPPIIHRPHWLSRTHKVPLVIALHGGGELPAEMEQTSELSLVANKYGFVVAYLDSPPPLWRAPSDITYISHEISRLTKSQNIDPRRVYVTGFSLGGYASYRSACLLSRQVAAIAVVSQIMAPLWRKPCPIARPIAELDIIGSKDFAAWHAAGHVVSADQTAAIWRKLDGCSSASQTALVGPTIQKTWTNCTDGTAVGEYVVIGGGHTWPHVNAGNPTYPSYRYDASSAIWSFFAAHPAPALTPTASVSGVTIKHAAKAAAVVASLRLGEAVKVSLMLLGDRSRAGKRFALTGMPADVRLRWTLGKHLAAGRYSLRVLVTDRYGRRLHFTRRVDLT